MNDSWIHHKGCAALSALWFSLLDGRMPQLSLLISHHVFMLWTSFFHYIVVYHILSPLYPYNSLVICFSFLFIHFNRLCSTYIVIIYSLHPCVSACITCYQFSPFLILLFIIFLALYFCNNDLSVPFNLSFIPSSLCYSPDNFSS